MPSLSETFPGFEFSGWNPLFAPTGTQSAVVQKVNHDLDRVLKEPKVAERLLAFGPVIEGAGTPDGVAAFVRAERTSGTKVARNIGITPK